MQNELKEFCESILNINASAISAFGAGLPGNFGKSAAEQGSMTPAADVIYELKRTTADFRQAYQAKDADKVEQQARKIEGLIMNLQTLSTINESQADKLLDQLHKLVSDG